MMGVQFKEGLVDDSDVAKLKRYLIDLGQRLAELDTRIRENDVDSRRSLTGAFRTYHGLARILAPEMAVPEDDGSDDETLAEEMAPWIDEEEHDGE
jgi:hypothetical protein